MRGSGVLARGNVRLRVVSLNQTTWDPGASWDGSRGSSKERAP